jgi:molecular chaperone HscA
MQMRALREEQVEAERILLATQSALDTDGDLLALDERTAIDAQMLAVREALAKSNDDAVEAAARQAGLHDAVQALAHGTEEFAARRMDKSVRSALAGKSLDQV